MCRCDAERRDLVVLWQFWLDLVIFKVSFNLSNSVILARPIISILLLALVACNSSVVSVPVLWFLLAQSI